MAQCSVSGPIYIYNIPSIFLQVMLSCTFSTCGSEVFSSCNELLTLFFMMIIFTCITFAFFTMMSSLVRKIVMHIVLPPFLKFLDFIEPIIHFFISKNVGHHSPGKSSRSNASLAMEFLFLAALFLSRQWQAICTFVYEINPLVFLLSEFLASMA